MSVFTDDIINIIALLVLFVGYFLYTPLIIYYWYKFNKMKNEQMMKYRSPTLVNIFNFISLSTLILYETYICFGRVLNLFNYPLWSFYFVIGINWCCVLDLFSIKIFLLFYNQKYNMAVVNSMWQKDINSSESNWYITNRNKFGNANWILLRIFLPFYICSVLLLTILPSIIGSDIITMHLLNILIISVPLIFSYIISYKAKYIIDAYGIRDEIIKQCFFVFLSLFVYFIAFLSLEITKIYNNNIHISKLNRLEWCSYMIVGQILICGLTMSSTYYPIYLFRYKTKHGISTSLFESDEKSVVPSESNPSVLPSLHIEYSTNSTHSNKINNKISNKINGSNYIDGLQTILRSNKGLSLFMQHLINEFAIESLLFIIELIHIKHAFVMKNYGKTVKQERLKTYVTTYRAHSVIDRLSDNGGRTDINSTSPSNEPSIVSLPSLQRTITPQPSDYKANSQTNTSNNVMTEKQLERMDETDPNDDYQVIDFNDIGNNINSKDSVYNSMAQNYMTVHSYLFSENGQIATRIELPSDVPYSSITTTYTDLYSQMKALYAKYIKPSCDHELNISHETKTFLNAALNGAPQKHESFYFNLFDFCGIEILRLLIRTFRRFRNTGLYTAYLDHVVLNENKDENINKQPIIIEGDKGNKGNNKRQKSIIPKFYKSNKYQDILSKYVQET